MRAPCVPRLCGGALPSHAFVLVRSLWGAGVHHCPQPGGVGALPLAGGLHPGLPPWPTMLRSSAAASARARARPVRYPDCLVLALHDDVKVAGPPSLVRAALHDLVTAASAECGLVPTGHKFTLYSRMPSHTWDDTRTTEMHALEGTIAAWVPLADAARGRRCVAQSDGVVVGGIPSTLLGALFSRCTLNVRTLPRGPVDFITC